MAAPLSSRPIHCTTTPPIVACGPPFSAASSIGCALVFGLSFGAFIKLLLWVIFVDCIAIGLCVAGVLWCVRPPLASPPARGAVNNKRTRRITFGPPCSLPHPHSQVPLQPLFEGTGHAAIRRPECGAGLRL